jgi:YD repeat-containing protein
MPPYSYQLRHDRNGRIIEKQETVAGKSATWKYSYDKDGRLFEAHLAAG